MKINSKAVLLGIAVDIVGSLTLGLLIMMILLGIYYASQGIPADEMETYMKNDIPSLFITIAIGLYFTFLGGFVAGRVAKSDEVLNASIVGIAGVLLLLFFWNESPLGVNLIGVTFTIPVAMFGGKSSIKKSAQPPNPL
jgi:hypothetical protein